MTENQLFGAGVRVLGLWLIIQAFIMLINGVYNIFMLPNMDVRSFVIAAMMLLVGVLIIKGARRIVKIVYPSSN